MSGRGELTAAGVPCGAIEFPRGVETLGEKADFLHRASLEFSKRSAAAAILAGWVLSVARSACAYGQWMAWLESNVSFSKRTCDNYLALYARTLGASRAAARRPVALDVEPTVEELEEAAHDVDGKALTALYRSTRLMARTGGWGGARPGAGRPLKDAVAALDEAAALEPALWAAARGALDGLVRLDAERDFLHRLSDDHLAAASQVLLDLSAKASRALTARIAQPQPPET